MYCNQIQEQKPSSVEEKNEIFNDGYTHIIVDSLHIKYWKSNVAIEYYLIYSNDFIQVMDTTTNSYKKVSNEAMVSNFVNYIEEFFMLKIEIIELSRLKRIEPVITDYSDISIIVFKGGKEVVNDTIQLGDEQFEIKFSPKFIDFINILDELVK